jgi:hypothetical protein
MIAVSAAFSAQAVTMIGTPAAMLSLAIGLTIGAALLTFAIVLLVRARRGGRSEPSPERRLALRRFYWVVAAEIVLIGVVNAATIAAARPTLVVPLDLIIIGLHFLPLAQIFGVSRFYATGLAFCIVAIVTLVIFPAHARIGNGVSRHVVASLGCTAVAWLTAIGNLNEAFRLISENRAHHH